MFILGINAYHADSAACLFRDGELIAAAEEERFRRVKHWAGLPTRAIQYCLEEAKIGAAEIDHVAINRRPRAHPWPRFLFLLRHRPHFGLVLSRMGNVFAAHSVARAFSSALGGKDFGGSVHHIEHHRAHLASAYFCSGFNHAACVSVDGCGDFASTAWGWANGDITINGQIYFPHSLGIFYSALTQLLGFRCFGDEYKVMGLAAYGQPTYLEQVRQVLKLRADGLFSLELNYFRHHVEKVSYHWNDCSPEIGTLYTPALETLLGPARQPTAALEDHHKNLARSVQEIYEQAFFALLRHVYKRYPCENLALAGGCALNSVANGKIYSHTPFRNVFVPPAPGDAGGAIGAALAVWHEVKKTRTAGKFPGRHPLDHATRTTQHATRFSPSIPHHRLAYTGPQFQDATVELLLRRRGLVGGEHSAAVRKSAASVLRPVLVAERSGVQCQTPPSSSGNQGPPCDVFKREFVISHHQNSGELCRRVAQAIAKGNIVGCFQKRMEWGPRALGNRSILGDPRRVNMKEILNSKIKRRESFRPFAPSILREYVGEWFEHDAEVPFMTAVFQVRQEKRSLIPAVTHVDGSGRLQTIDQAMNPFFHALISEFHALTSVPMVLNTSFNEQEPIVCHPEEALDCFLRTRMDALVMGGFFICRRP